MPITFPSFHVAVVSLFFSIPIRESITAQTKSLWHIRIPLASGNVIAHYLQHIIQQEACLDFPAQAFFFLFLFLFRFLGNTSQIYKDRLLYSAMLLTGSVTLNFYIQLHYTQILTYAYTLLLLYVHKNISISGNCMYI